MDRKVFKLTQIRNPAKKSNYNSFNKVILFDQLVGNFLGQLFTRLKSDKKKCSIKQREHTANELPQSQNQEIYSLSKYSARCPALLPTRENFKYVCGLKKKKKKRSMCPEKYIRHGSKRVYAIKISNICICHNVNARSTRAFTHKCTLTYLCY